jgi:hypothetical protein
MSEASEIISGTPFQTVDYPRFYKELPQHLTPDGLYVSYAARQLVVARVLLVTNRETIPEEEELFNFPPRGPYATDYLLALTEPPLRTGDFVAVTFLPVGTAEIATDQSNSAEPLRQQLQLCSQLAPKGSYASLTNMICLPEAVGRNVHQTLPPLFQGYMLGFPEKH